MSLYCHMAHPNPSTAPLLCMQCCHCLLDPPLTLAGHRFMRKFDLIRVWCQTARARAICTQDTSSAIRLRSTAICLRAGNVQGVARRARESLEASRDTTTTKDIWKRSIRKSHVAPGFQPSSRGHTKFMCELSFPLSLPYALMLEIMLDSHLILPYDQSNYRKNTMTPSYDISEPLVKSHSCTRVDMLKISINAILPISLLVSSPQKRALHTRQHENHEASTTADPHAFPVVRLIRLRENVGP